MRLVLIAVLALAGCATSGRGPAPRLRVAAAADLKFALEEVVRNSGQPVEVAYGASGNFYAQLQNRAPFDVFLSADVTYPERLEEQGLAARGSRFVYAIGRLALWTPAGSGIDVERLGLEALRDPRIRRVAIANPQHAPYGRAAEAALRKAGVYDQVREKLVYGENVAQAFQFTESGAAEAGVVALSLAAAPPAAEKGRYWEVPQEWFPKLEQGGVVLAWTAQPDAAYRFCQFLTGPRGRAALVRFGFRLPGA